MKSNYLVLDANAVYNYIGREKLGLKSDLKYNKNKYNKLVDKSVVFISSSVLAEVLVHFRTDLEKIGILIEFLTEKINYVLTASNNSATEKTVDDIRFTNDNIEKIQILNTILKSKSKIEVSIVFVFAGTISAILGDILIKQKIKELTLSLNPDDYSKKAMDDIISKKKELITKANSDLLDYYKDKKESQGLKKIYDEYMIACLRAYEEQLLELSSLIDPSLKDDKEAFYSSLKLSACPDEMYQTLARAFSDFRKFNQYKKEIKDKIEILTNGWNTFDIWQKKYISSRVEFYLGGAKFRKNDVFDTLFIGAFKDQSIVDINRICVKDGMPNCTRNNYHLLSFDSDLSRFIYSIDKEGALIIDRLRAERLFKNDK